MNMIKGRLDQQNPNSFIAADGMALPVARPPSAARGRDLIYGLRPEYMSLDPNGFAVTVAVIEPTGYETQLIVRFGGTDVTCVFRERVTAKPGEAIHLSIDAAHVHLFDAETGVRLID
jgi:multiple sugar transport system ATP-binding protein